MHLTAKELPVTPPGWLFGSNGMRCAGVDPPPRPASTPWTVLQDMWDSVVSTLGGEQMRLGRCSEAIRLRLACEV